MAQARYPSGAAPRYVQSAPLSHIDQVYAWMHATRDYGCAQSVLVAVELRVVCRVHCEAAEVAGRKGLECLQAESEDMRTLRVKERNRLYAARTRQRKNRLLQDLRQRCSVLEAENHQLQARVVHLQGEVDVLRCDKGTLPHANASGGSNESSPTPSTNTEFHVTGGPGVVSVKPAAVRTVPNQKAKNKLRFTAAAAACTPQEDAATPMPTSSHGSDSRGILSSETPRDKGTIQSYPGTTAKFKTIKHEPENITTLKRPIECTSIGGARRVRGAFTCLLLWTSMYSSDHFQ